MRISHIEFINHLVLGTFSFDIDSNLVSIVGKNGSGKSFLLSELHPYPTSSRSSSVYSIKKNESGLKRIIFEDNDIKYEIIHEYTPNRNQGHSAKSYFNIYRNNIKEELNDTGNGVRFKELVKEYLKFDHKTITTSHISFKTNGLTDSSAKQRRDLLADMIESKDLVNMQKNCVSLNKLTNMLLQKLSENNYGKSKESLETLQTTISTLSLNKVSIENKLKELDNEIILSKEKLSKLENLNEQELHILRQCVQVLEPYNDNDTIQNLYQVSQENEYKLQEYSQQITHLEEKYYQEQSMQNMILSKKEWRSKLNEIEANYNSNLTEYNNYIKLDFNEPFIQYLDQIESWINDIRSCKYIHTLGDINDYWEAMNQRATELEEFLHVYNQHLQNSEGGKEYNVEPCPSNCTMYQKFVSSGQFVNLNKDKADKYTLELLEINNDRKLLSNLPKDNWNNILASYRYIFQDSFISKLNIDKPFNIFISNLTSGDYIDYIISTKESLTDLRNLLIHLKEKRQELIYKLDSLQSIPDAEKDLSLLEKELNDKRDALKLILSSHKPFKPLPEILASVYATTNKNVLKGRLNDSEKLFKEQNQIRINDQFLQLERNTKLKELENTIQSITLYGKHIEDRIKIQNEYNELDNDKKVYQRCRILLEKQIPLILLTKILTYLEEQTNNILEENNIPIEIQLETTDTDILIHALVEDKYIEDVSQLSSGESCLISLIMNACVGSLSGYPILCLDEVDANLDVINRKKFAQIIDSLSYTLNIDQVICISHSIESGTETMYRIMLGDVENLNLPPARTEVRLRKD